MTTKTPTVQLDRIGSHFVTIGHHGGDKEELYGYFTGEWRGQPVMVTMQASRYKAGMDRDNLTWTEWRCYAQDARYIDEAANGRRGADTTDTARARLSDACRPAMVDYLNSDTYAASRAVAVARAVQREINEARYEPTAVGTRTLAKYRDEIGPHLAAGLADLIDATAAYSAAKATAAGLIDASDPNKEANR